MTEVLKLLAKVEKLIDEMDDTDAEDVMDEIDDWLSDLRSSREDDIDDED